MRRNFQDLTMKITKLSQQARRSLYQIELAVNVDDSGWAVENYYLCVHSRKQEALFSRCPAWYNRTTERRLSTKCLTDLPSCDKGQIVGVSCWATSKVGSRFGAEWPKNGLFGISACGNWPQDIRDDEDVACLCMNDDALAVKSTAAYSTSIA